MPNSADLAVPSSQLRATLSKMAFALSWVDESVVWTDGDGRIQWCNAAFEQLVNQTTAALAEQKLTQLLPLTLKGEPVPLSHHPASWGLANKQRCEGQYGFRRHDRSFALAITAAPLPGSETDLPVDNGVMLVIRNVTAPLQPRSPQSINEREEAERISTTEIRKTNRWVTNILESITDAFYTLDRNWCFTYINHQAEQLLQRSRADLLGSNIWEHFPEAVSSIFDSEYHRAVETQCSAAFESFYTPLNTWFEVRVYPLANGLAVYFQDISERKRIEADRQQTEMALRESEQRFRNIFDTTAVSTAVTALEGTFLQANAAYCQTLGYTEAELRTRTFQQITHPDDIALDLECIQKLLAGETSYYQIEKRYLHKCGDIVWGLLSVLVVRDLQQQPSYYVAQMQNISDRKQAEAALRESETRLRLALEAAQMSTWDWDIQNDTVVCAGSPSTDLAVSSDTRSHAYASFLGDVHLDDRAFVERSLALALKGAAYNIEFRVHWAGGTQHWVGSQGQVYFDQQGRPVHMLGVGRNITKRKQAELALQTLNQELEQRVQQRTAQLEESNQQLQTAIARHEQIEAALRKSEERFRTIFDNAPIAISLADIHTYQIVEVNQAHHALLGYSNADLATMTHVGLTHPDDINKNLEQLKQLLDGIVSRFRIEKRFVKKNGDWIWATLTVTLIRDPYGRVYSMGMIEDITDRKRTEESLRLTQFSIDRATDPIWWVKPDSSICYVNDAACRDLGYTRDEIIGKQVSDFNLERPVEAWAAHWDVVKEKSSLTFETRLRAKNGTFFPSEVTVNYIELNGKEYHCSFVRNITDRKQAEDQLKASLKEKEILLKEIHHRVKNNLQTVSSLLNLQANTIRDPKILAPFRESQNRIKAMVLLHEKLYQSQSLVKINFHNYVHSLVANLLHSYSSNPAKINLKLEISDVELSVDAVIPCGFIINELVTNALKYAFPDDRAGEIQISFSLLTNNQCLLVIADNGVGIPESIVWSYTNDLSNLNSLGLQLVHAFLHQLRGTLEIKHTRGSRFELSFPNPV